MCNLVTREAPDFTAQAVMPSNVMEDLTLSSFKGRYVCLFFYPLDFTFVCPSEILAFNRALDQFKAKNCEIIGVSVDSQFTHFDSCGVGGGMFSVKTISLICSSISKIIITATIYISCFINIIYPSTCRSLF